MLASDSSNDSPFGDGFKNGRLAYPYVVYRGDGTPTGIDWSQALTAPTQFEDNLPTANFVNNVPANASLAVGAPGSIWLTIPPRAAVSGVHLFASQNQGATWQERDQGLAIHTQDAPTRLLFAPSDPKVGYIVSGQGQSAYSGDAESLPPLMHVTTDGGRTWQSRLLPVASGGSLGGGIDANLLDVDPMDSNHLYFLAVGSRVGAAASTLWESSDGGRTWTPHASQDPTVLTSTPGPLRLMVTHSRDTATRFLLEVETGQGPAFSISWYRSLDLGVTWQMLPVPTTMVYPYRGNTAIAADALNPDALVWASATTDAQLTDPHALEIAATTDGFNSPPHRLHIVAAPGEVMWLDALTADRQGDFFVALRTSKKTQNGLVERAKIIAFRPSAVTGSTTLLTPASPPSPSPSQPDHVSPGNGRGNGTAWPTEPPAAQPRSQCQLTAGATGAMAFDGRYIDLPNDTPPIPGSGQSSPGSGVILRFDSACRQMPPLTLRPSDFPGARFPPLIALSYAATYRLPWGREGALLAAGPTQFDARVPATNSPIYAIDPVTGAAVPAPITSVDVTSATPGSASSGSAYCSQTGVPGAFGAGTSGSGQVSVAYIPCGSVSFFAWDVYRAGLWATGIENPQDPTYPNEGPGYLTVDGSWQRFPCLPADPIAATVGGDGYLYLQAEDDVTVYKMDSRDCSIVGGFTHPFNSENSSETEQIACDPLSFEVPVIWIRDSQTNEIAAYPAPDAVCPFPTELTYSGPAAAKPGSTVPLCFTLTGDVDGQWGRLPGQPISVTFGGVWAGQATTDHAGQGCIAAPAPVASGVMTVEGHFPGSNAYLPSRAAGPLMFALVAPQHFGVGGVPQPSSGGASVLPTVTAPQLGVASAAQPAAGVSTTIEAQVQAQTQSQAQAQSMAQVQPGVMVQRRNRTQVATQAQSVTRSQSEYQAVRSPNHFAAVTVAVGFVSFGFMFFARRPRAALARARRH